MLQDNVSFKLAMILKDKGFNERITDFYTSGSKPKVIRKNAYMSERDAISNWNNGQGCYPTKPEQVSCSAPTLVEVLDWMWKNKGLWISCLKLTGKEIFYCEVTDNHNLEDVLDCFKTPKQAIEKAIEYCLNIT